MKIRKMLMIALLGIFLLLLLDRQRNLLSW